MTSNSNCRVDAESFVCAKKTLSQTSRLVSIQKSPIIAHSENAPKCSSRAAIRQKKFRSCSTSRYGVSLKMVFFAFSFRNRSTDRRESALALADVDFDEIDFFEHFRPPYPYYRSRAFARAQASSSRPCVQFGAQGPASRRRGRAKSRDHARGRLARAARGHVTRGACVRSTHVTSRCVRCLLAGHVNRVRCRSSLA